MRNQHTTPEEWLEELFEFELCECCGGDVSDHDVVLDALGLRHALCREETTS